MCLVQSRPLTARPDRKPDQTNEKSHRVCGGLPVHPSRGRPAYLISRKPPPVPFWHIQVTQTSMAPWVMLA